MQISNAIKTLQATDRNLKSVSAAKPPDFAQVLVELGIDSISLIPDTVIKTTLAVLEKEKEMAGKKK